MGGSGGLNGGDGGVGSDDRSREAGWNMRVGRARLLQVARLMFDCSMVSLGCMNRAYLMINGNCIIGRSCSKESRAPHKPLALWA